MPCSPFDDIDHWLTLLTSTHNTLRKRNKRAKLQPQPTTHRNHQTQRIPHRRNATIKKKCRTRRGDQEDPKAARQ
eukprot:509457-Amphidinium_carterae.4